MTEYDVVSGEVVSAGREAPWRTPPSPGAPAGGGSDDELDQILCPTCLLLVPRDSVLAIRRDESGESLTRREWNEALSSASGPNQMRTVADLQSRYDRWFCPGDDPSARSYHRFDPELVDFDTCVIALVGLPRSAKSSFLYHFYDMFRSSGVDGWTASLHETQRTRWNKVHRNRGRVHIESTYPLEAGQVREAWRFHLHRDRADGTTERMNLLVFDPAGEDPVLDQPFLAVADVFVLFCPSTILDLDGDAWSGGGEGADAGAGDESADPDAMLDRFAGALAHLGVPHRRSRGIVLAMTKADELMESPVAHLVPETSSRRDTAAADLAGLLESEATLLHERLRQEPGTDDIVDLMVNRFHAFGSDAPPVADGPAQAPPWLHFTAFSGLGARDHASAPAYGPSDRILDPVIMALHMAGHLGNRPQAQR